MRTQKITVYETRKSDSHHIANLLKSAGALILDFLAFRTVRDKFLLLNKPPGYGAIVTAAAETKTCAEN